MNIKAKIKLPRKISLKLTLSYSALFFLTLLLLNLIVYLSLQLHIVKNVSAQIKNTANTHINEFVKLGKSKNETFSDRELLAKLLKDVDVSVNIINSNYEIINTSELNYINKIPLGKPYNKVEQVKIKGTRFIYINYKIPVANGSTFYMQIFKDTNAEDHFLNLLQNLILFTSFIGLTLSILFGNLLSKKMLSPIDKITKAANNITANNLNKRIEVVASNDEISRLSETINDMIDRLEKSFSLQSRFVSDASHELRTPISVISGHINMLNRWGAENEEILHNSIGTIKSEVSNMRTITENLLFLAHGDSQTVSLKKRNLYLNDLINEVIEETRLIDADHKIIFKETELLQICSDSSLIRQALRAIIDNSIKYTPKHGTISINCYDNDENACISVKDTGIGIHPDDIPHLFERFYRGTLSQNIKGTGLGLSVVKSIMDIMGGKVNISSIPKEGTEVTFIFPKK